jgi:hypothetical protein
MVWDTLKQGFVTSIYETMCTVGQASLCLHDFCIIGLLKKHCVSVVFAATVNGQSLSKVGRSSQGYEITLNTQLSGHV